MDGDFVMNKRIVTIISVLLAVVFLGCMLF